MLASRSRTWCDHGVYLRRNNKRGLRAGLSGTSCRAASMLTWVLVCAAAPAQQFVPDHPELRLPAEDPGHFEVRAADLQLSGGVYYLDASIDYRLSSDANRALQSGVPLTIRVDVEVLNKRRFWFDNEAASLRQRYQLEYHALSERYLVLNLNSGMQSSFATLFSALRYLGRIEHLPLIDASLLNPDHDYDLRLRAVLDQEQFPGPLRLLAFWRRDWSLGSDWYRWHLQRG
jgi:Domain of unknown function (DUF4390)